MPIYAYRCESCGHAKDVLQKVSDPLLTVCPACHAETFKKQLTAAGFQLKGSGWYVTDFRGGNTKTTDKPAENGADKSSDNAADKSSGKPASNGDGAPAAKTSDAGGSAKTDAATAAPAASSGSGGTPAGGSGKAP